MRRLAIAAALLLAAVSAAAAAQQPMRFWNRTTRTITGLYLEPSSRGNWGPNQCLNAPGHAVGSDGRLTVTGVEPGRYDVKLVDKRDRTCIVANVKLQAGRPYAFAISNRDLTSCDR